MSPAVRKLLHIPGVMLFTLVGLLFIQAPLNAAEPAITMVEGKDYTTKFPNEKARKPMVVEFFSYMCPHCYTQEAKVARWQKQKPESVQLLKIPVSFGRADYTLSAKSYYIAEELKLVKEFSKIMFKRIHLERKPPRKMRDIEQLFASLGVSSADFKKAASSFGVDSKMRKANFLTKKFKVTGIPYFLVNFKYEVSKEVFANEELLFPIWNNLPGKDF